MKIRDFLKNEDGGLSLGLTLTRRGTGSGGAAVPSGWSADSTTITADSNNHTADGSTP